MLLILIHKKIRNFCCHLILSTGWMSKMLLQRCLISEKKNWDVKRKVCSQALGNEEYKYER